MVLGAGRSYEGMFGMGLQTTFQLPTELTWNAVQGKQVKQISVGFGYIMVLTEDGLLFGAGNNENWQLGLGTENTENVLTLNATKMDGKMADQVSAGGGGTLFITKDNRVFGMGINEYGELGTGHTISCKEPTEIQTGEWLDYYGETIVQVSTSDQPGCQHTLLRDNSGNVYGMGCNNHKQLGNAGGSTARHIDLPDQTIIHVYATLRWSWLLNNQGKVYRLGNDVYATPTLLDLADKIVSHIVSAYGRTHFLTESDEVLCFGFECEGSRDAISTPQVVSSLSGRKIVQVSVGWYHSIFLDEDGYVYSMGSGSALGTGSGEERKMAVRSLFRHVEHIAAGHKDASFVVMSDSCPPGTIYGKMGQCLACEDGYYCDSDLLYYSDQKVCPTATWSKKGAKSATECTQELCSAGYFCELGKKTLCPEGEWREVGEKSCSRCGYDSACSGGEKTSCLGGDYCSHVTGCTTCSHCEAGNFIRERYTNPTCEGCSIGYVCPGNGTAVPCERQYYAPDRKLKECRECPSGRWVDNWHINCSPCIEGYECPDGKSRNPCTNGTWSAREAEKCEKEACGIGYACNNGFKEECKGSWYTDEPGSVACKLCPSGYFTGVSQSSIAVKCEECEEGSFCDNGMHPAYCPPGQWSTKGADSREKCFPCSDNTVCFMGSKKDCTGHTYANTDHSQCWECSPGFYTNGEGEYCRQCPANSYCPDGIVSKPCPDGKMSPPRSDTCDEHCPTGYACKNGQKTKCTGNHYSSETHQTECEECEAGYFTGSIEGEIATSCSPCPEGAYCSSGMLAEFCPPGTWSSSMAVNVTDCYPCEGNVVCSNGKQTLCAGNKFASDNHASCIICPPGRATQGQGKECFPCVDGAFCDGERQQFCPPGEWPLNSSISSCEPCTDNVACLAGNRQVCTNNTYVDTRHASCEECTPGFYTNDTGLYCNPCPEGSYCDGVHIFTCPNGTTSYSSSPSCDLICPAGYACFNGVPMPCLGNWYSSQQASTLCSECMAGYFTGHSGDEIATSCSPCPEGFYCPNGMLKEFCPPGMWSSTMAVNVTDCYPCEDNFACSSGKQSVCKGTSFADDSHAYCLECFAGHWISTPGEVCEICPEGNFCDGLEKHPCSDGTWSHSGSSNAACRPCSVGYECINGTRRECSGRYYSPEKGSTYCKRCPEGFYTGNTGVSCLRCPSQYQCHDGIYAVRCEIGDKNCSLCHSSYYPVEDETTRDIQCRYCEPGFYCPDGHHKHNCTGAATSLAGAFKEEHCIPCPEGKACLNGAETVCRDNTYSTGNSTHCSVCRAGYYIEGSDDSRGNTGCHLCPVGNACPSASEKIKCPMGSFSSKLGSTTCETCDKEGTYTDDLRAQCLACPVGSYCPSPTEQPKPCFVEGDTNTNTLYSDTAGASTCKVCAPSYYISKRGEECTLCDRGSFCPDGFSIHPCPNTTYTEQDGASSTADCSATFCPKYYHCVNGQTDRMTPKEIEAEKAKEAEENRKNILKVVLPVTGCFLLLLACVCLCAVCIVVACLYRARRIVKHKSELAASLLEGYERDLELDDLDEDVNRAKLIIKSSLMEIEFTDLKIIEKLGAGGSESVVFKAEWNQMMVAVKVFSVRRLTGEKHYDEFQHELTLMGSLRHPRLVSLYGACLQYPRIGLVMEYCPQGTLRSHISNGKSMSKSRVLQLLIEICEGMTFLHSRDVIHRDLKNENVLLNKNGSAMIADFGLARHIDAIGSDQMTGGIGTSYYAAPEVVLQQSQYDQKVDVYSFSMMMYELFTGEMNPYGNEINPMQAQLKSAHDSSFRPDITRLEGGEYSEFLWLLQASWSADASKRPEFSTLKNHFMMELEEIQQR